MLLIFHSDMKYLRFNKLILGSLCVETWKLYGDAVWWTLCTPSDVAFLNLLWADLQ